MTETFKTMVPFTKAKNQESWLAWSGAVGIREYVFRDFIGKHTILAKGTYSEETMYKPTNSVLNGGCHCSIYYITSKPSLL